MKNQMPDAGRLAQCCLAYGGQSWDLDPSGSESQPMENAHDDAFTSVITGI